MLLRLQSEGGTNRLTNACVLALIDVVRELAEEERPLVITGNKNFFSAGAEMGLVDAVAEDPVVGALRRIKGHRTGWSDGLL